MTTITTLTSDEIARFDAFSSITSATFTSGNLTTLVETYSGVTRTTTMTYSSGNIATLSVVWSR